MSSSHIRRIVESLRAVQEERGRRSLDPEWGARVIAIKQYQSERFRRTYADLLSNRRYAPAARFFLNEVYGPQDFKGRDDEFARIVLLGDLRI